MGSFTTGSTNKINVAMVRPRNNTSNVATNINLVLQFNQSVFNVNTSNVTIHEGSISGLTVPFQFLLSASNQTYQIVLNESLKEMTRYFVVLNSNITNTDGQKLDETVFNFVTGDFTNPEVVLVSPVDNAVNLSTMPIIQFRFNESVNNVVPNLSVVLHKDEPDGREQYL